MEGINIGGILLGYLGVLVFGLGILVAVCLLIASKGRAALIAFAAGLLGFGVVAALAVLTFLDPAYVHGLSESLLLITALSLVAAAAGQFLVALRTPRHYGIAMAGVIGSILLLFPAWSHTQSDGEYLLTTQSLGLAAISLTLAASSLAIGLRPPRSSLAALVWAAQAVLGISAGFAAGDAMVSSRFSLLDPAVGAGTRVYVEVRFLESRVFDEIGMANIGDNIAATPILSAKQDAWTLGPPIVGGVAGLTVALAIGEALGRQPRRDFFNSRET
jgi:hypothetical protein